MKMKFMRTVVLIMILAMVFTGCAKDSGDNRTTEPTKSPATEAPAADPEKAAYAEIIDSFLESANAVKVTDTEVIFADGSGRDKITVLKNPAKVAVLYGSYVTLWYETGGTVQGAVGGKSSTALYKNVLGRDVTQDEDVTVLTTSSSGGKWDVESIIGFQPDLIICSTAMTGYDTISGPAEATSIPVIAVDYNNLQDYLKWFKVFSNINGNPEKFDEIAVRALEEAAEVMVRVSDLEGPGVISLYPIRGTISANLSGTLIGDILVDINASNVADKWENSNGVTRLGYNLEQLVAGDPEYILIQASSGIEAVKEAVTEAHGEDPVWNSLKPVINNKVYYLERELFHYRPNGRYGESYKTLAGLLYPDVDFDN